MGIDFYYTPGSAPCRIVQLTAKAVGVDLNLKLVDLMKGEHMKPEFLKINPQHNVPCIVDGDLTLNESRAIATYLVSQYGKDDSLYPKDPKKRAIVDQRLYFDMGTLYQRFGDVYYPMIFGGAPKDEEKAKRLQEAYTQLDGFLAKTGWAAGDHMTVADLALVASVTTAEVCEVDISKHPHVSKWLAKCKSTIPGYKEANEDGVMKFKAMYDNRKK
ncbi:hypothetical protein O3M35_007772 [Rhynocoris fuscipes]|uniref:Uncharacterized protein n=1 Tax=Rhynocoris fuscipes TaxID=488301 RepID=A0AAW1DB75_9HEMI